MRALLALSLLLVSSAHALTAEDLVSDATYDPNVVAPEDFLPHEMAERHLRHDQIVAYMRALADSSDRALLLSTGRTHEFREQTLLVVSHPDNIARIDEIRENHIAYLHGESDQRGPVIVWLGYGIHGNEPSASNSSPLAAYHFAAAESAESWLRNAIVLIEPAMNPDGMGRFAHWVNTHKGYSPMADPVNREHNEGWPGGRFNHYWFDLNRDWLPVVHEESRNRVRAFQDWRPHVFADFHEMGSNSTYFFQPGVPERKNPLTPTRNVELTTGIAKFHARALDEVNQLYFSEEVFDDFYYGKGSTYPDAQGSVGILFEQASVRGHLRQSRNGTMDFAWAVRNQFLTSLSTVEGAVALGTELRQFQRDWVTGASERAKDSGIEAWVFGAGLAPYRTRALADIFLQHRIEVRELTETVSVDGRSYEPGEAFIVPVDQPQTTLIQAMFETRTSFEDSTFYDVSAWTMPHAFDLPFGEVRRLGRAAGEAITESDLDLAMPAPRQGAYAYLIEWDHYLAPKALARLQQSGIQVRVATSPFTAIVEGNAREFYRGTLLVARGIARNDRPELEAILATIANEDGIRVWAADTGLTPSGIDLGSGSFRVLERVNPILVTGDGVFPPDAGEVWHLLDTRVGLAPVMVDTTRLPRVDLDDYTHLILVRGSYSRWSDDVVERIKAWVRGGGVLITTKSGSEWATEKGFVASNESKGNGDDEPMAPRAYGDFSDDFSKTVIGGALVRATVDTTHPLAYGYREDEMVLFRNGTLFLEPSKNPYETPLRYTDDPLVAGYIGDERRDQLAGSAAIIAQRVGGGAVIRFADNPNFRGFWFGTNKLFLNALFFGEILSPTPVPDTDSRL